MLRITVELLPGGDATNPEILGIGYIINDATGTNSIGNYRVAFSEKGAKRWWKKGKVTSFPRLRLNAWDLLYRSLKSVVGERNMEGDSPE